MKKSLCRKMQSTYSQLEHGENKENSTDSINLSLILDDNNTISLKMKHDEDIGKLCKNLGVKYNLSSSIVDKLNKKISKNFQKLQKENTLSKQILQKEIVDRLHYKSIEDTRRKKKNQEKERKEKLEEEYKTLTFTPTISKINNYKKPFKNIEDKLYYDEMKARHRKGLSRIIKSVNTSEIGKRRDLSLNKNNSININKYVEKSKKLEEGKENLNKDINNNNNNNSLNNNYVTGAFGNPTATNTFSPPTFNSKDPNTNTNSNKDNLFVIMERQNSIESITTGTKLDQPNLALRKETDENFTINNITTNNINNVSSNKVKKHTLNSIKTFDENAAIANIIGSGRTFSFANKSEKENVITPSLTYTEKYKIQQMNKDTSQNITLNSSFVSSNSKIKQKMPSIVNVDNKKIKSESNIITPKIFENNPMDDSLFFCSSNNNSVKKEEELSPLTNINIVKSPDSCKLQKDNRSLSKEKGGIFKRLYIENEENKKKKENWLSTVFKKECSFKPSISKKSKEIIDSRRKNQKKTSENQVFDRLFNESKIIKFRSKSMHQYYGVNNNNIENKSKSIIYPQHQRNQSQPINNLISSTSTRQLSTNKPNRRVFHSGEFNFSSSRSIKSFNYSNSKSNLSSQFKIRELKNENELINQIENLNVHSDKNKSLAKNKTDKNIEKFKLNNLKRIFELIYNNCKEVNDFLDMEKFGVGTNMKEKLILPACYIIKERNLEFNFQNFYLVSNEIMNIIF